MKPFAAVLMALLAAAAVAADEKSSVEAKRERNAALVAKFADSCAEFRVWFRLDAEGQAPEFRLPYFCPNCNSAHYSRINEKLEKDIPLIGCAFAVAPNRFLVQDLRLLSEWVGRMAIRFRGETYPAKAVTRYPEKGALLLETERPVAGVKPLEFSAKIDFLKDKDGVFFYSTTENGLAVCGTRGNTATEFTHYADIGRDISKACANAIAVNASNDAVTVVFKPRFELGQDAFDAPAQWKTEPVAAFEERVEAFRETALKHCVAVYCHLDDEDSRNSRRFRGYDESDAKTDIDLAGLVLPEGEIIVPLKLDASQMGEIDRMEATLPDGTKHPLEFVGAFTDYKLAVLRFADGKLPAGLEAAKFDDRRPVTRYLGGAYETVARNFGGKLKLKALACRVSGFKLGRGGEEIVPDYAGADLDDGHGGFDVIYADDGSVLTIQASPRDTRHRWDSDETIAASRLSTMISERDFDPQFAIRKGKDRIRVAWIGVETQRLTDELAREKKISAILDAAQTRGALVSRVWPNTPAAKAGLKEGDVLLNTRLAKSHNLVKLQDADTGYGIDWSEFFSMFDGDESEMMYNFSDSYMPWPNIAAGVNSTFTAFGIGKKVIVAFARDGVRREVEMTLEQAPVHYGTAKRVKLKDLGIKVSDMTFEVRGYFKFDEQAPGVVVVKVQQGNPAAIAGVRPLEIITHVDNEPVKDAKDFARKVKGRKTVTFSVRRLAATRVVRIDLASKE